MTRILVPISGTGLGASREFATAQAIITKVPVVGQFLAPVFSLFDLFGGGGPIDPYLIKAPDDPAVVDLARTGELASPVRRTALLVFDPKWSAQTQAAVQAQMTKALATAQIAADYWKAKLADLRVQVRDLNRADALGDLGADPAVPVGFDLLKSQLASVIADVDLYKQKVDNTQAAVDARNQANAQAAAERAAVAKAGAAMLPLIALLALLLLRRWGRA